MRLDGNRLAFGNRPLRFGRLPRLIGNTEVGIFPRGSSSFDPSTQETKGCRPMILAIPHAQAPNIMTYTYDCEGETVTIHYYLPFGPTATCEHDQEKRRFRLTEPDGTTTEHHDRAVRFLVECRDPESGELEPVIERGGSESALSVQRGRVVSGAEGMKERGFTQRREDGTQRRRSGNGDAVNVRRGKVLIFSGCNSHPATGSLQPVAIGAAVEVTKPSEPSRQTGRLAARRADRP